METDKFNYFQSFVIGILSGSIGTVFAYYLWKVRSPTNVKFSPSLINRIRSLKNDDLKMTIVVRSDLLMGKGKIAAQCCHAAVECSLISSQINRLAYKKWKKQGQAKVVLKCSSELDLMAIYDIAKGKGLVTYLVHDAGRTQIDAGEATAVGIGPDTIEQINSITGHLKLL